MVDGKKHILYVQTSGVESAQAPVLAFRTCHDRKGDGYTRSHIFPGPGNHGGEEGYGGNG